MIQNANSSGQGFDPDHSDNPFHDTLAEAGFRYSHSTPVVYSEGRINHHTYKRGSRLISAWKRRSGWSWSGSARPGSGRRHLGKTGADLARYLKNARD